MHRMLLKKMVADYNKAVSTVDIFAGKGGAFQGQAIMQSVRQAMNNVVTFFSRWQLFIHIWYSIKARWNDGS